jgi:hypothetical protein
MIRQPRTSRKVDLTHQRPPFASRSLVSRRSGSSGGVGLRAIVSDPGL